jgi:hypothetical protein
MGAAQTQARLSSPSQGTSIKSFPDKTETSGEPDAPDKVVSARERDKRAPGKGNLTPVTPVRTNPTLGRAAVPPAIREAVKQSPIG